MDRVDSYCNRSAAKGPSAEAENPLAFVKKAGHWSCSEGRTNSIDLVNKLGIIS